MKELKNLQELINEKAERRLDAEISAISNTIKQHHLLRITDNPGIPDVYIKDEQGEYRGKKPYWFFDLNNGTFFDKVKEYWLPIYIAEETENFIKKVDELDSEIQGLKNIQYAGDY